GNENGEFGGRVSGACRHARLGSRVFARLRTARTAMIGKANMYFQCPSSIFQPKVERYSSHPCFKSPFFTQASAVGRVWRARMRGRARDRLAPPGETPHFSRASRRRGPQAVLAQ